MARRPPPWLVLSVVAFGVFIAADDLTVVTTMLRQMISDFNISLPDGFDDAAWIVDAYLIAYVAVMPFAGRISDIVGRRRVFVGALGLFLVGSVIIPTTDRYAWLIVGRLFTAVGGGSLVPVGLAVVGDVYPPQRRAPAMGVLGAVDTMGWVWGPLFGALLIRFLDWRWQFYLNIPLAVIGIAAAWVVLADLERPRARGRVDWAGAAALTIALVALNVALLESSDVQSVTGLDELIGARRVNTIPFFVIALVATAWFVMVERRARDPMIDTALLRKPNFAPALGVNFLAGATLIIVMVDVPLFINVVETSSVEAALVSGRVLSALTVAMALFAYVGGRATRRWGYRPVTLAGLSLAGAGFVVMGFSWHPEIAVGNMAWELGLLGIGLGLITAPTNTAAVDAAPPHQRGTAAGLVIVARLVGLSVGLSGLTAWALYRYNALRAGLVLPPLTDPGYGDALRSAQAELTSSAIAETFLMAAVVTVIALLVAGMLRRQERPSRGEPAPVSEVG